MVDNGTMGGALRQIKERGYADKYAASGKPVYLIGVEFSKITRNITEVEVESFKLNH